MNTRLWHIFRLIEDENCNSAQLTKFIDELDSLMCTKEEQEIENPDYLMDK